MEMCLYSPHYHQISNGIRLILQIIKEAIILYWFLFFFVSEYLNYRPLYGLYWDKSSKNWYFNIRMGAVCGNEIINVNFLVEPLEYGYTILKNRSAKKISASYAFFRAKIGQILTFFLFFRKKYFNPFNF